MGSKRENEDPPGRGNSVSNHVMNMGRGGGRRLPWLLTSRD